MHRCFLFVVALLAACRAPAPEPDVRVSGTPAPSGHGAPSAIPTARAPSPPPAPLSRLPEPERLVAVGDLHGDLEATRRVLRLAGAIDQKDRWMGGKLVLVQTGDQIDRGDDDRAVIELFDRIADEAEAVGGKVVALNGNHEAMNVAGDFRYVTPASLAAFSDFDPSGLPSSALSNFPEAARPRLAAFVPGGAFARRLGRRDVVALVGRTVFVHGGVTESHVRYGLSRLNGEVRSWMNGEGPAPALAADPEGPLWTRRYSDDHQALDCSGLTATLRLLGAARMVVGHTPHEKGISPACEGRVYRIDTGLSRYYGGALQALEIRGERVTALGADH